MAAATSTPADIPPSKSLVKVSMIDTTVRISNMCTELLFSDPIPGFDIIDGMPVYAFLIEHIPSGLKLLFDAGARIDWKTHGPPAVRREIEEYGWHVTVEKGIDQILLEHGVKTSNIAGVIWSHFHWDHVGDMTLFPKDVPIIVGPGFKKEFFPGWPEDPDSTIDSAAWSNGRELIELHQLDAGCETPPAQASKPSAPSPEVPSEAPLLHQSLLSSTPTQIAHLPALDLFSDSSIYILSTPGHTPAHLSLLLHTSNSPSEYILLAADAFDNAGQIRPSPSFPLPDEIVAEMRNTAPRLLARTIGQDVPVDGGVYTRPFLRPEGDDNDIAVESLAGLAKIDARTDVLTLCAHEKYHTFHSGAGAGELGIEGFPGTLNGWRERRDEEGRNLRERLFWWFLKDFGGGADSRG